MFKVIARALKVMDNSLAMVENVSEAGEIASRSTITLANNFNTEQEAKLKAKREQLEKDIKDGKFDL